MTAIHWGAVILATITGIIHLGLGLGAIVGGSPQPLDISFILAGLGFFGAVILFLRNYRRTQLYLVGILYTALQIVLWYIINQGADPAISPVEAIDKVVQVLLILTLAVLFRRET